jgi:hypothetical protein
VPSKSCDASELPKLKPKCTGKIFFASIPPIADIYLNGVLKGRTNTKEIRLPCGSYCLEFRKDRKRATLFVTIDVGKNPSQLVKFD